MACDCKAYYKIVPVSKTNQSSDLFTPNQPVRPTQSNVGQFFLKEGSPQDGYVNQFSDVVPPSLKPRDRPPHFGDPPPCPQKHGKYDVVVPPPGKEAHLINQMNQQNKNTEHLLPYKKQLFPRPRYYERQGFKTAPRNQHSDQFSQQSQLIQPPLHQFTYTPETRLYLNCVPNYRSQTLNPYVYNPINNWYPEPQFWYFGNQQPLSPTWPVGNPDDYTFIKLPYPSEGVTLLEKMEIERPERYLPGEIYRNESVKRPIEDLSKKANCSKVWKPKDSTFCDEFKPDQSIINRPRLLDEVLERKEINRGEKEFYRSRHHICSCNGIKDTETKEKNDNDPNMKIDCIQTGPCRETCTFAPDLKPKPNACDLSKKKSKLPIGVLRKIYPHIDEQISVGNNEMKERLECKCKDKGKMLQEEETTVESNKTKFMDGKGLNAGGKPKVVCKPIEPGLPKYDQVFDRICELSQVGQPFKSDAINQDRCIHPPPGFVPIFREGKRKFPDFGLSHI